MLPICIARGNAEALLAFLYGKRNYLIYLDVFRRLQELISFDEDVPKELYNEEFNKSVVSWVIDIAYTPLILSIFVKEEYRF